MDRLDALSAFVAIADLGSFARAARRLGVSPQAVTRAIATLEGRLGVVLFHRSTRAVRLSDDGAAYLEHCRLALAQLAEGERALQGRDPDPHGLLSATAPVMFGRMHVAPVVAALLRAHPRLRVRLMLIDRFVNLVEEGIDVALRIGDLTDSALRARRLGEVRQILVAAPSYLDRRGEPDGIAALSAHDLIAFGGFSRDNEWRFGSGAGRPVRPVPRLWVNSADTAIAAAAAGLGITCVYSYQAADALADGRLRTLLAEHEPPAVPVQLVFPANRAGSANVRAFVDASARAIAAARL